MLVPPGKPPLPARRAAAFPFCAVRAQVLQYALGSTREPRPVRGVIFARQPLRVMLAAAAADPTSPTRRAFLSAGICCRRGGLDGVHDLGDCRYQVVSCHTNRAGVLGRAPSGRRGGPRPTPSYVVVTAQPLANGQLPSLSGRNASSAGIVARSL